MPTGRTSHRSMGYKNFPNNFDVDPVALTYDLQYAKQAQTDTHTYISIFNLLSKVKGRKGQGQGSRSLGGVFYPIKFREV